MKTQDLLCECCPTGDEVQQQQPGLIPLGGVTNWRQSTMDQKI